MHKIEYILLAGCVVMFGMLIIPKIISYERARNEHARPGRYYDIFAGTKTALDSFEVDNGYYPKSLQDLVQRPNDATNWHGPYLEPLNVPVDPWDHKFFYEYPGKHNTNGFDLFSAGPDGKVGTKDDIGNWDN